MSKTLRILDDYRHSLRKFHDANPRECASYFLDLGVIYRLLGKFSDAEVMLLNAVRAKKTSEASREDALRVDEEDRHLEITLYLDELGNLYLEMANYEKAEKFFEKSLEIRESLIDRSEGMKNSALIEKGYNNMGLLYLKTWSLTEAVKLLERNFKPGYKELKIEHINPDCAFSYALVGKIKEEEGLYREAFQYYSNYKNILITLNITREHPDIARSCLYLGNLFERIGSFTRAITEYEEAIEICKKNSDTKDNLTLADSYSFMGSVYFKKANFEKAAYYYRKSLKKYNQIYNPDGLRQVAHQNISNIYIKQGMLQEKLGKFVQAEKTLNDALEIVKQIFGDGKHPDQAVIYNNLGLINFKLANSAKALKFHKNAIGIIMNVYKISQQKNFHPEIGRSLNYMGLIMNNDESLLDEARKNFETASKTYDAFFRGPHPDKALTLLYMGLNLKKIGKYNLAEETLNRSLDMMKSFIDNENHPDIIACYRELGSVAELLKDFPKAIEHTVKSLDLANFVYKAKSLDQAQGLKQLANIYLKLNDLESSEKKCEEALKVCKEVLGTELHPEYISALKISLSICKAKKGPNSSERAFNLSEQIRNLEEEFAKSYTKSVLDSVVK
jgi:tetratricopeptide (TPR) repeat protein